MEKSTIQEKYIVTKSNRLNEIEPCGMSLQGLRFFSIYLSKINPFNEHTRKVCFRLRDFQKIMELKEFKRKDVIRAINDILTQTVGIPLSDDGEDFSRFQVFKECNVIKDSIGEQIIIIDAHDKALPLMFNLKGHYFKYELWNALRPKSRNQLRMYEILKQYEHVGARIITIEKLKKYLGIKEEEYARYSNFKTWVLDRCQKALTEQTDISFTYESYGKKGYGGKYIQLKFIITKNKNFKDNLKLGDFIDLNSPDIQEAIASVKEPTEPDEEPYEDSVILSAESPPEASSKTVSAAQTKTQQTVANTVCLATTYPVAPAKQLGRKPYGRFQKVKLTDEEYSKLTTEYNKVVIEQLINELDSYIASNGKQYKDHYVTLIRWYERAEAEKKANQPKEYSVRGVELSNRQRDWDKIERMEQEYLIRYVEGNKAKESKSNKEQESSAP